MHRSPYNVTEKEKMQILVNAQPDDASYEEILRELSFERMVDRGLTDVHKGNVISNEDMSQRTLLSPKIQ